MSGARVVLAVLATLALTAAGCFALSSALVLGGRTALWLEAHRWVYAAALALGCVLLAVASAAALWPLAALGAALALVAVGRYVVLNV